MAKTQLIKDAEFHISQQEKAVKIAKAAEFIKVIRKAEEQKKWAEDKLKELDR